MNQKYMKVFFFNHAGGPSGSDITNSEDAAYVAKPKTRREYFLCDLAAQNGAVSLDPKTRWEIFMAKIVGDDSVSINPKSREEHFLEEFVKGSKDLDSEDAGADTGAGEQRI